MKLNFWERFQKPKDRDQEPSNELSEQTLDDLEVFKSNFRSKLDEAKQLLSVSDENSEQSVLSKIEILIIDAQSNLDKITECFKKTQIGQEYFIVKDSGESDSLILAQQTAVLDKTPFSNYPKMVSELENFRTESRNKLIKKDSWVDSYQG